MLKEITCHKFQFQKSYNFFPPKNAMKLSVEFWKKNPRTFEKIFIFQLPEDENISVKFRSKVSDLDPTFKCDLSATKGCFLGHRSPDGRALEGFQYRTHQCFWLGEPCSEKKVTELESRPYCSNPNVKICGFRYPIFYKGLDRHLGTYFFFLFFKKK